MVDSFDSSTGSFDSIKAGVTKFTTAAKKFNRVPLGKITLGSVGTPYNVQFDNFLNPTYNYYYNGAISNFPLSGTREECLSEGKISAQEWGPSIAPYSYVAPFILSDIDIGAAPALTDYLDVQATMSRITTPPLIYNHDVWPIEFIEGQQMNLTDAALTVEKAAGMARMLWFEIVGGRILLRRRQSVDSVGYPTHLIQNKVNNPSLAQLGPSHAGGTGCSITMTTDVNGAYSADFTSVYACQFIVTPCCSIAA